MSQKVHTLAQKGFGTGTNELYDKARPSYQATALAHIRKSVRSSPPLNVVELGAGTGIFTRALLAHPDWSDAIKELRAVEPSEGMRDVFTKSVSDPRVSVREGTFDTTGIEDGWADLVVIAQAFHWCPDYDKAAAEFARILKPEGIVAFIWNLEDRNRAAWVAQLRDRIEQHENGAPQFRLGLWRATFSTPSYQANFEPPEENVWDYVLHGTRDIVVNRACSKSYIAVLGPEDKQKVISDIDDILQRKDGLVWIDEKEGLFEYPYQTFLVIAKKK
ncbi:S-adenosyl-L-methionine-dependent methyltransferase [Trametes coccinea BRFM310]|uniref:S-adenosyl-L-methionine-dependent methyltransferase n=1 Tax=Trametes coccinea (strain BRFM310) TaxID=1353009 RepID=A0A1Y2ID21_TRAC3|nr:S-adenosyl-L-methionine-dependent methyltransferase [Trametes coccinea BRFM310]